MAPSMPLVTCVLRGMNQDKRSPGRRAVGMMVEGFKVVREEFGPRGTRLGAGHLFRTTTAEKQWIALLTSPYLTVATWELRDRRLGRIWGHPTRSFRGECRLNWNAENCALWLDAGC